MKDNVNIGYVTHKFDIIDPQNLTVTFTESWNPSKPGWINFDKNCK